MLSDFQIRTDVTNYEVLQKSIDAIVEDFGRIDGL